MSDETWETRRDDRLLILETHATSTEARLSMVERTLDQHGQKLDRIVSAVTASSARREFDPAAVVSFVKDAAILLGLCCTAIIYVATGISDRPVALLEQRQSQFEKRIERVEGHRATTTMGLQ